MKIDTTLAKGLWRQMLHDSVTLAFFVDTYIAPDESYRDEKNYQGAATLLREFADILDEAYDEEEKGESK